MILSDLAPNLVILSLETRQSLAAICWVKSSSDRIRCCLTDQKTGRDPRSIIFMSNKSANLSSTFASYAGMLVKYEYLKSVKIAHLARSSIYDKILSLTNYLHCSRFSRACSAAGFGCFCVLISLSISGLDCALDPIARSSITVP